jgi:hypothetical protein
MSNGEVCCILGVCCPPESFKQADALRSLIAKQRPSWSETKVASKCAQVLHHTGYFRVVADLLSDEE